MSRYIRVVSALPVLALVVAAAAACSTTTAGLGAPGVPLGATPSITASDTGSASSATAPSSTDAPSDSSSQAPTLQPSRAAPTTSATSKSVMPTPSPTATAAVVLTSFTVTSPPACGGGTTGVNATLTWVAKNATEVWILGSTIRNPGADPRTSGERLASNPDGGAVTVNFDCSNSDYYYNLTVYNNLGGGTHNGIVLRVPKG